MKKITVITTGGTIGSILNTEFVSVDTSEKRIANEILLAKSKLGCTVVIDSPINKNSEDLSPIDWVKILQAIKKANESDSTGIVITHGTDTLSFSVAAALAFSNQWKKKICFTGSYFAPNHPSSDTPLSLLASHEFATFPHPASGVFVAFRSNRFNSEAKIIHGASLKPMNYDDLFFESAYNENVAVFSPKNGISDDISLSTVHSPCLDVDKIPEIENVRTASSKIGLLTLYPGIDKKFLAGAAAGRDILVIQAYHSGTGPSNIENGDLMDFIQEVTPNTKILMGTFPQKYLGVPYESTLKLKAAGAHIYSDLQTYFLYVFALLGLSMNMPASEIVEKMKKHEI